MPIASLLGVQFDLHLLGSLGISVAAVVLISWVYRFYSSRASCTAAEKTRLPFAQAHALNQPGAPQETSPNRACRKCKTELRPQCDGGDADKQAAPSQISSVGDNLTSDRQDAPKLVEGTEISKTSGDSVFGSSLKPPGPGDGGGPARPTGQRSPCFLLRLEGGTRVGVGRELRQNLGLQGGYSSFLSKAEVTMADTKLVLAGSRDRDVVRGKIYDYYVESSSSHSTTDATGSPRLRQFEGSSRDSLLGEFGSRDSSLSEPLLPLGPIVIRDLVPLQSADESADAFHPVSPEPRPPSRPILLRKQSYLTAAKHSELHIPTPTLRASSRTRPSKAIPCTGEISPAMGSLSPMAASRGPNPWEEPSLKTVAGGRFLHVPEENKGGGSDLEGLAGKLDLGNCLEVLSLAKKRGQARLQDAALRVMSDNYFQVLRDPGLYGRLMAGEREQIRRLRTKGGRQFLIAADVDPRDWMKREDAAEAPPRTTFSALHYYDDHKDTWHRLCLIPREVISKGCAMCTMDNYLFVALGCRGTEREMKPSKRVFCYNPITSIWKEVSPMNEARPHCKLAALQGHVYAIGGECLSTVERYDPRSDRWTFVAPLPNDTFAVAHRVTASDEELFVSGGTLRYTLLRYNPKTNAWRKSLIMGSKERTAEMVAVRSFLYRFDISPVLGVGVYRYHTSAHLWYECCSKRLLRCPAFQCVAMDDAIYCVSRQFTMRFLADAVSPVFADDNLSVLAVARGVVFPFVLSLPNEKTLQTSV